MKGVISALVMVVAAVFALGPLATALVDMFCWIVTGSQLTTLDWADGGRAGVVVVWTLIVPLPTAIVTAMFVDEVLT